MGNLKVALAAACAVVVGWAFTASADIPASAYVQNGLIVHFDALENAGPGVYDGSAATWADLSGHGCDATLKNSYAGCWTGTSLKMNNSLYASFVTNFPGAFMVEVICSAPYGSAKSSFNTLFCTTDDNYSIYMNGPTLTFKQVNSSNRPTVADYDGSPVVAFVDGKNVSLGYHGGALSTKTGSALSSTGSRTWSIGGADSSHALVGEMYAVRVYDHVLDAEELAQNALLDDVRFSSSANGCRMKDGKIQVRLAIGYDANCGTVSVDGVEVEPGDEVWVDFGMTEHTIAATPVSGCSFFRWRGSVDPSEAFDGTLTVKADRGRSFSADFGKDGASICNYVQDGLIARWDGIETGGAGQRADVPEAGWTDLVSGLVLEPVINAEGGYISSDAGCVSTYRAALKTYDEGGPMTALVRSLAQPNKTVEICGMDTDKANYEMWFVSEKAEDDADYSNRIFYWYNEASRNLDSIVLYNQVGATSLKLGLSPNKFFSVSATVADSKAVSVYQGGVLTATKSTSAKTVTVDKGFVKLGSGGATSTYVMNYNSVRIYDRTLTAKEVAFNAAVDQVGFDGADPQSQVLPEGFQYDAASGRYKFRIKVESTSCGSASVDGATEKWGLPEDEPVTVTAVPDAGCKFLGWTGDTSGLTAEQIASRTLTLGFGTARTLTANFRTIWGAEYFVAPDVVDTAERDCSTPEKAGTLTNALARITREMDIITLLPGTYYFTNFTPYAKTSVVNVSTKSYFVGNVPVLIHSQDDDPSTVTLVGGGTDVDARCFCFGGPFVLSGVTITNFYTSGSAAAVYSTDRSAVVSNCVINGNTAAGNYGALYNLKPVDCSFDHNFSRKNAGVGASLDLVRCNLIYNGAAGDSYASVGASVQNSTADGCTFQDSYYTTYFSGGLMISGSTLTNCTFRNAHGVANSVQCVNCTFYDCDFYDNYVRGSSGLVKDSTLYNCVFSNNYGSCTYGLCVYGGTCHSCRFVQNVMSNLTYYCGGTGGYGGKYYDCYFASNKVVNYLCRGGALHSPVLASNCVFVANWSGDSAGAVGSYNNPAEKYLIQDSFFTNNWINSGGGGCLHSVTVSNCVINGSHVDQNGTWGGAGINVRAFDSVFEYNVLHGYHYAYDGGGALGNGGCAVNCIFRYNQDLGSTSVGGACVGVAMTNCLVYGNYTESKGYGGCTVYATVPVVNCTIVSNTVPSGAAACAGTFINCIIADNTKDVWNFSKLTSHMTNCLFCTTAGTSALDTNNCVQVANGTKVKFTSLDPESENAFRLTRRSPARDFGCDVGLTADDRDLDGLSRVYGKAIDVGCYECHIPPPGLLLMVK